MDRAEVYRTLTLLRDGNLDGSDDERVRLCMRFIEAQLDAFVAAKLYELDTAEVYRNLTFLRDGDLDGSDLQVIAKFAAFIEAHIDEFLAWADAVAQEVS